LLLTLASLTGVGQIAESFEYSTHRDWEWSEIMAHTLSVRKWQGTLDAIYQIRLSKNWLSDYDVKL
jgi:hypothetical protein